MLLSYSGEYKSIVFSFFSEIWGLVMQTYSHH